MKTRNGILFQKSAAAVERRRSILCCECERRECEGCEKKFSRVSNIQYLAPTNSEQLLEAITKEKDASSRWTGNALMKMRMSTKQPNNQKSQPTKQSMSTKQETNRSPDIIAQMTPTFPIYTLTPHVRENFDMFQPVALSPKCQGVNSQ